MDQNELRAILEQVSAGEMNIEEAVLKLKKAPFDDLGFAKTDHHRALRQGIAEVIYGEGKTVEQIEKIAENLIKKGQKTVLITRLNKDMAEELKNTLEFEYYEAARIGVVGEMLPPKEGSHIVVATGGTSDIPVAEEAAE